MNDYGIQVHVRKREWSDSVDIYVLAGGPSRSAMTIGENGEAIWVAVDPSEAAGGTEPPRLLTLRYEVWDALQREVGRHTQATDATVEALRDTRQVRDRLLTLVERWESS